MPLFSDEDRKARAALRAAREELARISDRDRCESDDFLDANDAVIEAEKPLPWWKRLDIEFTA